jgi:hypothetical protein
MTSFNYILYTGLLFCFGIDYDMTLLLSFFFCFGHMFFCWNKFQKWCGIYYFLTFDFFFLLFTTLGFIQKGQMRWSKGLLWRSKQEFHFIVFFFIFRWFIIANQTNHDCSHSLIFTWKISQLDDIKFVYNANQIKFIKE